MRVDELDGREVDDDRVRAAERTLRLDEGLQSSDRTDVDVSLEDDPRHVGLSDDVHHGVVTRRPRRLLEHEFIEIGHSASPIQ